MAVEARYFLDGQAQSARFADFVPQEMKYVALIARSWDDPDFDPATFSLK